MIFKAYDVRGIYPDEINEDVVTKIAYYFTDKYDITDLVIARDVRESSSSLAHAFIKGVKRGTIEYRGILPTPMLYFFSKFKEAGVVVTASHNPPEYNGLKIVYKGRSLTSQQIFDLKNSLEEHFSFEEHKKNVKEVKEEESVKEYASFIQRTVSVSDKSIAIDFSNGSLAAVQPFLFSHFPQLRIKKFNEVPDGTFPSHPPDPSKPANLKDLIKYCSTHNIVGFGFDGDGDRLGVIDEKGNHVSGDRVLALLALNELQQGKEVKVITEVNVSKSVIEFLRSYGIEINITRVGHTFIEEKMYEGYGIGGELSGHYYFNINGTIYEDAILAMFKLLEFLNNSGKKLYEWVREFPYYYSTPPLRIQVESWKLQDEVIKYFQENYESIFPEYEKVIDVDGIRVEMEDGWFIIRKSNTEPVIALRIEAKDEKKAEEIKSRINKETKKWGIEF